MPAGSRWSFDLIKSANDYLWKVSPNSDEAEEVMQGDIPHLPSESPTILVEPPRTAVREDMLGKLYVKTDVLKQIGYTTGCPECRALQGGKPRAGHNDTCRNRATGAMKNDAAGRQRIKATRERENEFLAKAVQDEDGRTAKQSRTETLLPPVVTPFAQGSAPSVTTAVAGGRAPPCSLGPESED